MAKTVIDIDEEALRAAQEILGTSTKVDTVNAALREVVNRLRRLDLIEALGESDLADEEVMQQARHTVPVRFTLPGLPGMSDRQAS